MNCFLEPPALINALPPRRRRAGVVFGGARYFKAPPNAHAAVLLLKLVKDCHADCLLRICLQSKSHLSAFDPVCDCSQE